MSNHKIAIKKIMNKEEAKKYPTMKLLLKVYSREEIPEYFQCLYHRIKPDLFEVYSHIINGFTSAQKELVEAMLDYDEELPYDKDQQLFLLTGKE